MNAVEISNLTKTYRKGRVHALRGVSFTMSRGEIFGLLGPNGAGKTTLVKIMLGIIYRTAGDANILGRPVPSAASRRGVGFMPEDLVFPAYMNGRYALKTFGRMKGVCGRKLNVQVADLIRMVGMGQYQTMKIKHYSRGMRRRIGIALALLGEPDVVFLDEPTDGLDPIGRKYVRDLLLELKNRGKTVFLNSHLLGEVEMICDRVAILSQGEVLRIGTIDELTSRGEQYRLLVTNADAALDGAIERIVARYRRDGLEIHFAARDGAELDAVIDELRSRSVGLRELTRRRETLEDVFFKLTSGEDGVGLSRNN